MFEWAQFMNNPETSESCPLQVSVQTLTEKNKFVFNRILQMTYHIQSPRHIRDQKKKKKVKRKKRSFVLGLQFVSF